MSTGKYFVFFIALLVAFFCKANPIPPGMPEACRGKLMCRTKSKDYPEETIEKILASTENFYQPITVVNRDGNEDEASDCDTWRTIEPIYEIIDENGDLRFVVQSQNKFKQIIRTEECLSTKPKTKNFTPEIVEKYNLSCETKHIDYNFIVLNLNHTRLETTRLKGGVPVCCSCRRPEE